MLAVIETVERDEDRELLSSWYDQFHRIMRQRAYDIVDDYHLANDMVQEAFIKIIKNIEKIKEIPCYKRASYFVNTIDSVCYDYLRKKKSESKYVDAYKNDEEAFEESITHSALSPEEIYENKEFREKIQTYISQLSERDRKLILYKYAYDMTYKEIGLKMGIREQNVNSYLKRAKERLTKIVRGEV